MARTLDTNTNTPHTPQQHGRHHDYEGATEPLGPGEGTKTPGTAVPGHRKGVENPPDPTAQPDGFGEPDEPESPEPSSPNR